MPPALAIVDPVSREESRSSDPLDRTSEPVVLAPGTLLNGRYRIESRLGVGAMGAVFRATDTTLDRRVALKILHPDLASDASVVERMLVEARAAAAIKSEHVARVLDVGRTDEGLPLLVLEYLEGEDFFSLLRRRGCLRVAEAIDYTLEACEALAEAHAEHIVHRDLKPENLFLARRPDGSETVKVLDFGISKRIGPRARPQALTQPTALIGSPNYMAPEQLRMRPVDARTDVWALGATLYELLSGRPAFAGDTFTEVCARVLSDDPEPLSSVRDEVPAALSDAVEICLEKDPAARYQDVAELATSLAPFGDERSQESARRIHGILRGGASAPERGVSGVRAVRAARARTPVKADVENAMTTPARARVRAPGAARGPAAVVAAVVLGVAGALAVTLSGGPAWRVAAAEPVAKPVAPAPAPVRPVAPPPDTTSSRRGAPATGAARPSSLPEVDAANAPSSVKPTPHRTRTQPSPRNAPAPAEADPANASGPYSQLEFGGRK